MENFSKSIVIQQPSNKKYLLEKTVIEMKDQNDNQTDDMIKKQPFLIKQHQVHPSASSSITTNNLEPNRRVIHLCDGVVELDENGNIIGEVKRKRRSLKSVVKHQNYLKIFDSIDSPVLNSAGNLSSAMGRKTLSAIDYVGNMVANFLGITNPKYENEIAEANFKNEERKRRENVIKDAESGWK